MPHTTFPKINTHTTSVLTVRHEDGGGIRSQRLLATVVEAGEVLGVYLCIVAALQRQVLAVRFMRNFYPERFLHSSHQSEVRPVHHWN